MPTREVEVELAKSQPHSTGVGPVQDVTEVRPQSLLNKQRNLSAVSTGETSPHAEGDSLQAEDPRVDYVFSGGAETPASLVKQIDAQIRLRATAHEQEGNKVAETQPSGGKGEAG